MKNWQKIPAHILNKIWGRTVQVIPLNGDNNLTPIDPSVSYSYDSLDRLVSASRGGVNTTLTYDYTSRKTEMTDPDMGNWKYEYNPVGTLRYQRDARLQYICLYYDEINRLKGKHYRLDNLCPEQPAPYDISYSYDAFDPQNGQYAIGLRTGMVDASGSANWSFDSRGRLWKESRQVNSVGTFVTQWGYNQADLLSWMVYPADDGGNLGEQINYTYHPQLALNTLAGLPQYQHRDIVQGTSYDTAGRVTQRTLGENAVQTSYAYYPWSTSDNGGLLQQILTQTTGQSPTTHQDLRYALYDKNGNVRTIQDYRAGAPQTQSFEYDNLDRLTSGGASGGGQGNFGPESYSYDQVTGNLSSKAGVNYTYGDVNHAHAVTALSNRNTYSYDDNGNMTQPSGVTHHEADDTVRHFFGISATQFRWGTIDDHRVFEVEELRNVPTTASKKQEYGCRYVHSMVVGKTRQIEHLDGSIRIYSEEAMLERLGTDIAHAGRNTEYTKIWRIDGIIPISLWKRLISDYFRDNFLVGEYLGAEKLDKAL